MTVPCRRLLAIVLLLTGGALLAQQKPVVCLDPMANLSGEARLDTLCSAIGENIGFTLSLLGQFEVTEQGRGEDTGQQTVEMLRARATAQGYDNIIFGSCTTEGDYYVITVSAYDLATDDITYSESTVIESILDTFGAVDEITLAMVEGFSGLRVTYGSLRLLLLDTGEPYGFTIDGVSAGSPGGVLERVPTGEHLLEFVQERPLETITISHRVEVTEAETLSVRPPIPMVTGAERVVLEQGLESIRRATATGSGAGGAAVEEMEALLETPFYSEYRPDLRERYGSWRARAESRGTFESEKGSSALHGPLRIPGGFLKLKVQDLPYSKNLASHLVSEAELSQVVSNYVPTRRTITVDGDPGDWVGIPSLSDRTGDFNSNVRSDHAGVDLQEVRFAYDSEYLYVMLRSADGIYRHRNLGHKVHFRNGRAGLFFDYWLTEDWKVWVGWDETSSVAPDTEWATMRSRVEVEYDEVMESAIPIRRLLTWPYFNPVMRLWIATTELSGDHRNLDTIDEVDNIALPVREILTLPQ